MSLIVTYKGSEILNLTASAQKTLTTAGTYCEANIGIDYNDESVITPVKDGTEKRLRNPTWRGSQRFRHFR